MRAPVLTQSIVIVLSLLLVGVAFAGVPSDAIPPDFWDVVVLATNSIHAKNGSTVVSGHLVANGASPGPVLASGAELTIGPKATTSAGSILKGDSVRIRANTQVGGDVHYNDLVNQGTVAGALVTPLALPVFATLPPFAAALPGATDIVVPAGGTATVPPGDYGHLTAGGGAHVVFEGGDYSFLTITAGAHASLGFDAPAGVKVAGQFAIGPDSYVGPTPGSTAQASRVVFFVAGVNGTAGGLTETPSAAEIGPRTMVQANFYVPNGTLHLQNGTSATGAFLGRDVVVGSQATLTLASAYLPPVAVDDSATLEVGGTVTVLDSGAASVLANDQNPKGGPLTVTPTPVSGPTSGVLVLGADGTFSYTHDGSETLSDSFVYEVCDGGFPVFCDTATVSITVVAPSFTVTVQKVGTGSGRVMSTPPGIDCGGTCSAAFEPGSEVTLNPVPDEGSIFVGWGGHLDCADGSVTGPDDRACVAVFDVPGGNVTLAIQTGGTGTGRVLSEPAGIDCSPTCSAAFPQFTRVELFAVADPGSTFVGFGGDPDCEDGFVEMNLAKTCTATFDILLPPSASRLEVVMQGAGAGTVTSNPPGIACGAVCAALFPDGTLVTLAARAEEDGSFFEGWGGDCVADPDVSFRATVTIGPDKTCTATFSR